MAGGGVGEAMLIGAAVGAGTGGVMSAVKDEDPLQGALLGAAMGAAGGGLGSWAGGAVSGAEAGVGSSAVPGAASSAAPGALGTEATSQLGQQALQSAATTQGVAIPQGYQLGTGTLGNQVAASQGFEPLATGTGFTEDVITKAAAPQSWGQQGIGQGFAPHLTNAQAYGAGVGGGIMGLVGQNAQNQNNMAQEPETYTGPLSQFKYSPNTFRPSVAPGYADGGVASLGRQAGMYPQSQYDKTQFAVPSQMPISREVIGSDYDARISPYTGDIMMANGGISNLGSYSDGGRMLRGPGDGMSDNIPGVIAGKQPARLADGEFVVPADVVSHLGNGSTDAGAKKLYSMMDNVRKARTGSKKQGRQIKADKYVPGMKNGGIAYYEEGGDTNSEAPAEQPAAAPATVPGQGAVATGFQATGYEPSQQYSPYTMANRPSSAQPQYYGDIYQGYYPDYSAPGYTLAGNLGEWSNVAGEDRRAIQPMSRAQEVTQAYLQNLGRAPETEGFNLWMNSGLSGPELNQGFQHSPEATAVARGNINRMYQDIFGTQADAAGLENWRGLAQNTGTGLGRGLQDVRAGLQNAAPTQAQKDFVTQAYQDILGRAPDQAGFKNWTAAMSQGMTPEQVRAALQNSPEATSRMKMRSGGIASLV